MFLLLSFICCIYNIQAQKIRPLQIMDTVSVDTITDETDSATSIQEDDNGTITSEKKDGDFFIKKELFNPAHDSFQLRTVPDSIIKKLQGEDAFWYASHDFRKKSTPPKQSFLERLLNQSWFTTLIWFLIIGGFISVVVWYLISSNVSIFSRSPREIKQGDIEDSSENIFEINFEKEISKAISESQYRIAVRLMFLNILKNLSQKNIIAYKQGRTNFDYLMQIQSTGYYKDFFRLTRDYEYTWYGKFDISFETFSIIRNNFESFRNRIQ
jgi:hypothetical protein